MTRAQTTMDFAAGISIFLVTVAFAFAFLPGVITPFTDVNVGDPVSANRAADTLAADRLATPDTPYVLSTAQSAAFFDETGDVTDRLTIQSYKSVNVTIEDATGAPVAVNGSVTATAGPAVPASADTTVAWRTVTLDGDRLELVVRVW